jgi:hypothetical protein
VTGELTKGGKLAISIQVRGEWFASARRCPALATARLLRARRRRQQPLTALPPDAHCRRALRPALPAKAKQPLTPLRLLQIMPKAKAEQRPNGVGRDDPNANPFLPPPVGRMQVGQCYSVVRVGRMQVGQCYSVVRVGRMQVARLLSHRDRDCSACSCPCALTALCRLSCSCP